MHMAYARGADRIWVVNVGDIKAQEIPISHFFDMAYDAKKWTVDATHSWAKDWVKREFGAEHADQIAEIMMTYGMYAARRKFELVEPNTFSVLHYHEADAVLEQWAVLHEQAQAVYVQLDEAYRPAFFQMVLHPIVGGEILYKIQISGAKNQLYAGQKRNSANEVIKSMLALSDDDANLTKRWNQMLDGKWEHMMDRKRFSVFLQASIEAGIIIMLNLCKSRNTPRLRRLLATAHEEHTSGCSLCADGMVITGRPARDRRRGIQRNGPWGRQVPRKHIKQSPRPAHGPVRAHHALL